MVLKNNLKFMKIKKISSNFFMSSFIIVFFYNDYFSRNTILISVQKEINKTKNNISFGHKASILSFNVIGIFFSYKNNCQIFILNVP